MEWTSTQPTSRNLSRTTPRFPPCINQCSCQPARDRPPPLCTDSGTHRRMQIFDALGAHDVVVVTAISHALDEGIGALLTSYTGAPHLAQRARVVKWQIGFSFPSLEYFVDPEQLQICDTHWLSDVMGCAKEAYIRAPPLPLYYHAAARAAAAAGARGLASRKERLVLFDNDFTLDTARIKVGLPALRPPRGARRPQPAR